MSRRRNPRRTAKMFQAVLESSRRRTSSNRTPKKSRSRNVASSRVEKRKSRGAGTTRRGRPTKTSKVTESINLESDNENIDDIDNVKVDYSKNIESKVDNFFKSSNLCSDDEDDLPDIAKSNVKQSPKEPKEMYTLSDSDDDKPSTSKMGLDDSNSPSPIEEEMINITEESKTRTQTKHDELMDIVDEILDCEGSTLEIDTEPDKSWADFKSKTEEILGSVNALLDGLKNPEKEKPKEKVPEKSPEKVKPSCPICLEVLGGGLVAAATICGHIFCQDCIKKVAKLSKTCPTCRKRINLKQIHPLYL
ncbi:hypothetical protein JTB14_008645 [Gonioctena quinquepunctata]|nr:hypothetical protein JTB14_008645 [Gonioctena quinquepunctata]